uniref:Uncharacterized protein n=1 Tax=Parascaris univalens TaxID=6257 RepID=A0A915BXA0_PARUN
MSSANGPAIVKHTQFFPPDTSATPFQMCANFFVFLLILLWNFRSITSKGTNHSHPLKRFSKAEDVSNVWDVVIKTCDEEGAGTDAAAYLKVFYERDHASETFQLDNPGK